MSQTFGMSVLLTNNAVTPLTLVSSTIEGSSSQSSVSFPKKVVAGSTEGGFGCESSTTPYKVTFSYSPDGGSTLLTFTVSIAGNKGLTIDPSKTGPNAAKWTIGESPSIEENLWVVVFIYGTV